ncbi:hypothetical protein PR048_017123 [Dryococelus australis]|uniref:Uncharacterized protein n=1 Tax=Dryococelus australis TaxID=614101 RepID=A0ABQ9H8M7_9NEOP|nr:hypothetical protein PR048_017123 [Dryococelus australis]
MESRRPTTRVNTLRVKSRTKPLALDVHNWLEERLRELVAVQMDGRQRCAFIKLTSMLHCERIMRLVHRRSLAEVRTYPSGRIISRTLLKPPGNEPVELALCVNVYAPSGTQHETARKEFFRTEILPFLEDDRTNNIFGGNFNCVLNPLDHRGGLYPTNMALQELVTAIQVEDVVDILNIQRPHRFVVMSFPLPLPTILSCCVQSTVLQELRCVGAIIGGYRRDLWDKTKWTLTSDSAGCIGFDRNRAMLMRPIGGNAASNRASGGCFSFSEHFAGESKLPCYISTSGRCAHGVDRDE